MQTTHSEDAVLSYVISNLPRGIPYQQRKDGMSDFNCSPYETAAAIDSLRRRGVLRKHGPFYNLTDAGQNYMQPVIDQFQQLAA